MKFLLAAFVFLWSIPAFASCPGAASPCEPFSAFTNVAPALATPQSTDRYPYVQGSTTKYLPPLGPLITTIGDCATWNNATGNSLADQPCRGQGFNVEAYGAKCDGLTNDTVDIQATINAAEAQTSGNGIVLFPSATCVFTPPLTITSTVWLKGEGRDQSYLKEVSGSSANFINVGYQSPQINGVQISGLQFVGNAPTGGYAISAYNVGRFHVSDITLANTFCGLEDEYSNYDQYEYVWGNTVGTNCQMFLWYSNPSVGRSDQLLLHNIGINGGFYGNDGIVLEGHVGTINAQNIAFLQTNHGFWINSSLNTTSAYPAFGSIYNLQVEGAQSAACEIDGGRQFYFTDGFCHSEYGETGPGGVQGNDDAAALLINPDYTHSVTSDIKFENMSIGISANFAGLIQGQGIYFSNVSWRGSSLATPEGAPSVQINGTPGEGSADYAFVNNKFCGIFGDTI